MVLWRTICKWISPTRRKDSVLEAVSAWWWLLPSPTLFTSEFFLFLLLQLGKGWSKDLLQMAHLLHILAYFDGHNLVTAYVLGQWRVCNIVMFIFNGNLNNCPAIKEQKSWLFSHPVSLTSTVTCSFQCVARQTFSSLSTTPTNSMPRDRSRKRWIFNHTSLWAISDELIWKRFAAEHILLDSTDCSSYSA